MAKGDATRFEHSVVIETAPVRALAAFFDPEALSVWWQALRSVTTPRSLGVYAVEWAPTSFRDDVLGPLGGVFYGTVIEYSIGQGFFVGDAFWLPPEGEPIGPMGLDVSCGVDTAGTQVRIRQSGYEEGPRWSRYYAVVAPGWKSALAALKDYLEKRPSPSRR